MRRASVVRFAMQRPSDVSHLDALVSHGVISPTDIVAIVAKTEGNGSLTDYTVELAERSFRRWLSSILGQSGATVREAVTTIVEGGSEGVISPHGLVIAVSDVDEVQPGGARLAVGVARGEPVAPEEIGRRGLVVKVAEAVQRALDNAGLTHPEAVHGVLVLTPTLTLSEMQGLEEHAEALVSATPEMLAATSRRMAAIGVASVLKEADPAILDQHSPVAVDDITSSRAIVIAQPATRPQVLVFGNSETWCGPLAAAHAEMADALDAEAIRSALGALGFATDRPLQASETERVMTCFAKAEADPASRIRNRRHVMLEDADIHHTRHIRTVVGTVVAAMIGHPQVFVSAGAEAQGPSGGGSICVIGHLTTAERD
ncbi:MAG: ring-opening amidohydrolase, partial [Gemmatimonadales bacterium]